VRLVHLEGGLPRRRRVDLGWLGLRHLGGTLLGLDLGMRRRRHRRRRDLDSARRRISRVQVHSAVWQVVSGVTWVALVVA
jgi:hypothetical protein